MADKKLSVGAKVFLIVLLCLLYGLSAAIFGCASQAKVRQTPQMDSNHFRAQVQSQEPQGYGHCGPRNYGPTSVYQSDVSHQYFGVGGYSINETSTGFSEVSWYFSDRKTKTYRVVPHWTTRRYRWR